MRFAIRLLAGLGIAALTWLAARAVPEQACAVGWFGGSLYFILIGSRA